VLRDQIAPHRHRHVVVVFAIPRHLLDREAARPLHENRSTEQELQRNRAIPQRMEILRGGDLEVIRARQRHPDFGVVGESGHHRGGVLPEEGALRGGPALARPEQVDQALRLGVGIPAPQRVNADLTAQRDRVDRIVADRGNAQPRHQDRCRRIRFGRHVKDRERHLGHARSASASRSPVIAEPPGCGCRAG
jgi:hypothetical protein